MKVLTIKEPWASMILEGKKTIETRTWRTHYRGPVLLHAAQSPKSEISGCIFAIAEIVDCQIMAERHEKLACCEVYPNAKSWFLRNIRATELKKVKGKLGLWDYDCELRDKIPCNNCGFKLRGDEEVCPKCNVKILWALFG